MIKGKLKLTGAHATFRCPGCETWHRGWHTVRIEGDGAWGFNGNCDAPTFTPSVLLTSYDGNVCHSFVTDGQIQFLGDCTHALAGQTVPLPDFDEA